MIKDMNIFYHRYHLPDVHENDLIVVDIRSKTFVEKCKQICADGFKHPMMVTQLFDVVFDSPQLVLRFDRDSNDTVEKTVELVELVLRNFLNVLKVGKDCRISIQLDEAALKCLYDHTRYIQFEFSGKKEQREISGRFQLTRVPSPTHDHYTLSIDPRTIERGEQESTNYIQSFGTFHTHPYEAYKKYNVCIAWPSADDYISYLYMYSICLAGFHIVSTMEGLYIITLKKYIDPADIMKKFVHYRDKIEYHHGVDYPNTSSRCNVDKGKVTRSTIDKYVKRINKLGVFRLRFVTWEEAREPIPLTYSSVKGNCFLTEKQGLFYRDATDETRRDTMLLKK